MTKTKITREKIEGLPLPEKGWTYHYDLKVQGLELELAIPAKFVSWQKYDCGSKHILLID